MRAIAAGMDDQRRPETAGETGAGVMEATTTAPGGDRPSGSPQGALREGTPVREAHDLGMPVDVAHGRRPRKPGLGSIFRGTGI